MGSEPDIGNCIDLARTSRSWKINCNSKGNLRRNHYDNFSDNDKTTDLTLHFHYKNEALGTKAVVYSENFLEKKVDTLKGVVGEKIAFLKWGNAIFKKKKKFI